MSLLLASKNSRKWLKMLEKLRYTYFAVYRLKGNEKIVMLLGDFMRSLLLSAMSINFVSLVKA